MFFLNKNGDMKYGVLVSLIILLVTFIAIWIFTGNFSGFLKGASEDEICRTSILAAAQSKFFLNIGKPITPLKCPRKELVIRRSDVVVDGLINQDKAHKIIADEMFKCWSKVGAGKIDPFTNWKDSNWESGKESLCLICSYITFDDDLLEFMKDGISNKVIHSPVNYLRNTKIPNQDETYWEYLYGENVPLIRESELEKSGVLPNSLILVNLHKEEGKSYGWSWIIAGTVVGGTLAIFFIPAVAAGALVSAGTFFTIGLYATVASFAYDTFKNCPDCDGIGGLALVPDGIQLDLKAKAVIDGKEKEIPLCTKIVN